MKSLSLPQNQSHFSDWCLWCGRIPWRIVPRPSLGPGSSDGQRRSDSLRPISRNWRRSTQKRTFSCAHSLFFLSTRSGWRHEVLRTEHPQSLIGMTNARDTFCACVNKLWPFWKTQGFCQPHLTSLEFTGTSRLLQTVSEKISLSRFTACSLIFVFCSVADSMQYPAKGY